MRYLLLDRITELTPPQLARGVKCVSLADDIFLDHFPGHPIMPGALIVEALAQLGGVLIESTMRQSGKELHALLVKIDTAKFRRVVRPGDKMELEAHGITTREEGGQVRGIARVDGQIVSEAELTYAFAEVKNPITVARRKEVLNTWLTGSAETP